MTSNITTIFWFRQDLRITDNLGLFEATKKGPVMPIYILDDLNCGPFKMGGASRWWLHNSLTNLNKTLGNKLNVYYGDSQEVLLKILASNNVGAVYWNRCYEPWRIRSDSKIKAHLRNINIECKSFNGSLLWEPWKVTKNDGTPYKVYTYFYRKGCLQAAAPREPLPKPAKLTLVQDQANSNIINTLGLLPDKKWYKQIQEHWHIGEEAAQRRLTEFLDNNISGYKENRNYPCKLNVSRLSPHLHFGEISPNQVWYKAQTKEAIKPLMQEDIASFLSEIGWREFSYYLLYHFPDLPTKNFQPKFDRFPWKDNIVFLKAWQKGQTGYPIVDAGMRELWQTGYMHNRVRMIVGSFLVKNLLLDWRHGENWFWDCLLDADLANNSASWQWVAGSGADAAPYFRIFNPVTQGEKFDPDGKYTLRFVPELSKLPIKFLFKPWEAPNEVLKAAGIVLGKTYPKPIVNLQHSREQAIMAYNLLSSSS
ncbi:MAG: deoxyribodipyrimidine photo-lyase [Rickettsiaceae bacterium]